MGLSHPTQKYTFCVNFYYGATNNKTISRYDKNMQAIYGTKAKYLFSNSEWTTINSDDKRSQHSCAYLIYNCGHHPWT